jgi:hypothetical protein
MRIRHQTYGVGWWARATAALGLMAIGVERGIVGLMESLF